MSHSDVLADFSYEQVPLRDDRVEAGVAAAHAHVLGEALVSRHLRFGEVDRASDADVVLLESSPV